MEKNVQIPYDADTIAKSDEMVNPETMKELQLLADVRVKIETQLASIRSAIEAMKKSFDTFPGIMPISAEFEAFEERIGNKFVAELTAIMKREIERNGD